MIKTFLRLILGLFVGLLLTATCEAQSQDLITKIEETKLGNKQWDKVSVILPNASYKITKVSYENKQLLVVFDYSHSKESKPASFTFFLSDYNIDCKKISADDEFHVIAKHESQTLKAGGPKCPPRCFKVSDFQCPEDCPVQFRCPPHCGN